MRVPPKWVRRVVLAPLMVVVAPLVLLAFPPVLLLMIIVAALIPRRFRWPRAIVLALAHMLWDAGMLVILFALWVASGFGWKLRSPAFVRAHYAVGRFGLKVLFGIFKVILRLTIVTEGAQHAASGAQTAATQRADDFDALFSPGTPLVVASRHAGPGDSFVLIHALLNDAGRYPRIVVKDTMQWDPTVDVLLNRIPTKFITPTGFARKKRAGGAMPAQDAVAPVSARVPETAIRPASQVEQQIGELARDLGPQDAFVIFPEGGNVTVSRRQSRIERLRAEGRDELADRAEALSHVMPPQPRGIHAALTNAGDADVVFIAHAGLDKLITVGDIWKALPVDKTVTLHAWRVPRAEVPEGIAEQAEWLFEWFERIDVWIGEQDENP